MDGIIANALKSDGRVEVTASFVDFFRSSGPPIWLAEAATDSADGKKMLSDLKVCLKHTVSFPITIRVGIPNQSFQTAQLSSRRSNFIVICMLSVTAILPLLVGWIFC